jgi:TonB family protein
MFFGYSIFAQSNKKLVDNSYNVENSEVNQFSFANDFKVDLKQCTFRELKTNSFLNLSPALKSSEIEIPKGTVLETYPYYKSQDLYIILYDQTWGFILKNDFEEMGSNTELNADNYEPPKLLSRNIAKYLKYIFPDTKNGELLLDIRVSNTGAIEDIVVLKSIPEIDESKIDTLKKLRFKPAKRNGKPTKSQFKLPVIYSADK